MNITEGFQGVPYAYWFSKIKERTNQRIITKNLLKNVFMSRIICDDNKERKGGNKKGIPKKFLWPVVNDMQNINFEPNQVIPFVPLLKKINKSSQSNYEISTSIAYKKILQQSFPF